MGSTDATQWKNLIAKAADAAAADSSWERYSVPWSAIEQRSESDASLPPLDISAFNIPDEIRAQIQTMDQAIREAGNLPRPCDAWIGLELPAEMGHPPFDFGAGCFVCLVGIVSATLLPEPAIFAAGPNGALFRIHLHAALPMVGALGKPGEMELILPINSCFKVDTVHLATIVKDTEGRDWKRTVVEATQIPLGPI